LEAGETDEGEVPAEAIAATASAEAPAVQPMPEAAPPRADNIVALPQSRPAEEAQDTQEPARQAVPEPEPVAVVLTPPDPDRPKRAGWWSKAKQVLSGS
jgi:ribonuclease E